MVTRDEELKWAYLLDPCFELTNTAGKPLTDGYIEVYIAGTRNKYYCASDFAGTLHPFQIPLDSLGSNIVLANPDNAYDVYVYNRFGNLIMSRYNVTPADGGAVISNTERINDLEELVVSAVTGLQGQIDDINEALDGKKDKQEEYSVTLTPTQTVSAIMQNENGEIEVIYQEIDLPEEVPNVDIVSPASTINITTHIDEETNTKTFSIDLSDLGHLEYGQFMATQDVYTGANMYRIKGNLNSTNDGKIQLHKGNSYHITVRGYYTCSDISNTSDTLNYIEYSTFTPMPVNVDNTVAGPQYFEISYDVFKLSADTNYYIAFASSAGKVSNLTVEIHSLSNISILAPESYYQEGWGIDIVSSVISVDPTIFNDYSTHTEVYEATVTAIQAATSVVPDQLEGGQYINIQDNVISVTGLQPEGDYVTHDELDEAVTAVSSLIPDSEEVQFEEINLNDYALASAIPDVSDFTTHTEVYESAVTSIQLVTGLIPEDTVTHTEVYEATVTAIEMATGAIPDSEEVQFEEINLSDYALASAIPDVSDFTTHSEVYEAVVTGVQLATSVIPDPLEAGQYVSIIDNTITVTGLQPEGDYATHTEVYEATVTALNVATGAIPDSEEVQFEEINLADYVTHDELIEVVSAVTGIGDYGQFYSTAVSGGAVMARTKGTIDVTNDGKIKLKKGSSYHVTVRGRYNQTTPNNVYSNISYIEYITFNNININVDKSITESQYFEISYDLYKLNSDTDYYIFFSGLEGTVNDLFIEIHAIGSVGAGVSGGAGTEYDAGWGIQILNNVISVDPSIFNDYVTENELVTAIQSVVTAIPSEQVQSDWTEEDNTDPAYIQNKPEEIPLIAGDNIGIFDIGASIVIAASGTDLSDYVTQEELAITVTAVTAAIPEAQVQSDWTEDDNTDPAYIQNKPVEYNLIAGQNIGITVAGTDVTIAASGTDLSDYATHTEVYNAVVTGVQVATGLIPDSEEIQFEEVDLDDYATKAYVDSAVTAVSGSFTQVQSDWTEDDNTDPSYIQNKPNEIGMYAGQGITIEVTGVSAIISSEVGPTYTAGEYISIDSNDVITVTGLAPVSSIPDVSDMATQTWVGEQGYLTEVPSTYATDVEVSQAIASSVTGFVTEAQVTALLPDTEDVEFEELDITQFAQASAIPVVTGFATKSELSDVQTTIPTVQLNGDDQVTAINNHEIAGTGGTTYTAGEYISIENDEISVTGLEPLPEIVEMDALEIKAGTNISIVTGVSDITISVTGIEIPTTEDVTFEEINIANYALASAIPDVSNFVTNSEVTTEITEAVSGKQDLLTGITDVQVVTGLPVSPTQDVLYLIVEA